jgi:hypothetical protein
MIWLGWRQQRTEALIAAALLALAAAILIPAGIQMANAYTHDGLSHCIGMSQQGPICGDVVGSFEQRFSKYIDLVGWFNLIPGLFGVALAAPFVLELERGTHRLAWTQSITRRRWVTTKLGLAVASTLVAASLLMALETWWRRPLVHIDGRMENGAFDSNVVILGYALFALGLALAIGAMWRRAIPAVMVSFVGYFVARIFTDTWLRQRLASPTSLTWSTNGADPKALFHAWVINEGPSDRAGNIVGRIKVTCLPGSGGKCAFPEHPKYMHALFVPQSSFWSLQLTELALFGGVAVALIAFAGWWTLHRE